MPGTVFFSRKQFTNSGIYVLVSKDISLFSISVYLLPFQSLLFFVCLLNWNKYATLFRLIEKFSKYSLC